MVTWALYHGYTNFAESQSIYARVTSSIYAMLTCLLYPCKPEHHVSELMKKASE